jgi:hypothetical protein
VPASQVAEKQDGEEVAPFDRTTDIEVEEDGYVPMEWLAEYKCKEVYQLSPDTDKEARESAIRVTKLARLLLEKQMPPGSVLLLGRGYQY